MDPLKKKPEHLSEVALIRFQVNNSNRLNSSICAKHEEIIQTAIA